jgi:pectin methylesterase-like acyl-CoA thioesterase
LKTSQSQSKIASLMLAFSLLCVAGIALSTTVQAQYPNGGGQDRDRNGEQNQRGRNWDQYGNYGGSAQLRQTALNAGFNEGSRLGRSDRDQRNRPDFHSQGVYQNATKDYRRFLGDREVYRRYFREAFESGYNAENPSRGDRGRGDRDGNRDNNGNGNQTRRGRNWDQYGNYGGSFQLRQTALNAGYNDGIKQGRNDRNKRNANGYQGQSAYQNATHDYNPRNGDRELHRRYYREAYENGYEAGINGY